MFADAATAYEVSWFARPARIATIPLLTGAVMIGILLDLVESRVERG